MLFLTNTTISSIASVLMFLTKNTLCATIQKTNTQNTPDLQNSSQANQREEDETLAGSLKIMMLSELENIDDEIKTFDEYFKGLITEIKEGYKELQTPTENEEAECELAELSLEIFLILGKDVFQLKKKFTKEKYEDFLKHVGGFFKKMKGFESKCSSVLTDEEKKILYYCIKDLQELPEKSEEIFTADVVGKEKKEKIIKIIKEVKKPQEKNNNTVENKGPENDTI